MSPVLIQALRFIESLSEAFVGSYRQHYIVRVGAAYKQYEKEKNLLREKKILIPTTGADKINLRKDTQNVVNDFNKVKGATVKELELDLCL